MTNLINTLKQVLLEVREERLKKGRPNPNSSQPQQSEREEAERRKKQLEEERKKVQEEAERYFQTPTSTKPNQPATNSHSSPTEIQTNYESDQAKTEMDNSSQLTSQEQKDQVRDLLKLI